MSDSTLSEHLAKARAARSPDTLKATIANARAHRREPKPCNCGQPEGKHKSTCPVRIREYQQARREKDG